ncbi:hypothetical protein F4808DRAFT_322356 [Astrocystis sublimbata]|nr:hypothetical protein F4808DRAFT_322356 [Astrocystis sublimbata]
MTKPAIPTDPALIGHLVDAVVHPVNPPATTPRHMDLSAELQLGIIHRSTYRRRYLTLRKIVSRIPTYLHVPDTKFGSSTQGRCHHRIADGLRQLWVLGILTRRSSMHGYGCRGLHLLHHATGLLSQFRAPIGARASEDRCAHGKLISPRSGTAGLRRHEPCFRLRPCLSPLAKLVPLALTHLHRDWTRFHRHVWPLASWVVCFGRRCFVAKPDVASSTRQGAALDGALSLSLVNLGMVLSRSPCSVDPSEPLTLSSPNLIVLDATAASGMGLIWPGGLLTCPSTPPTLRPTTVSG